MTRQQDGMAQYDQVDQRYLEQRTLQKRAGWILLWALGVGAVISGDFYGWHFGLAAGGFWGLAIATLVMAAMYACMVFSIAELSAALPHAGGFYSFVRNAMGPTGGYLCGLTDTIEYVVTPAVIVVGIGSYLHQLIPGVPVWIWWVSAYGLFVSINCRSVELTLKVGLAITAMAAAVLVVFYLAAIGTGAFHWELLFNIAAEEGQSATWLPRGHYGIIAALPAAIWFYLAIEQLPLAAEESHDVVRDMPKALLWGMVTLVVLSLLTLVLNTGVGAGAEGLTRQGAAPLAEGFRAVLGQGAPTVVLTLVALTGMVASFHAIIYAYGRVLFALSRAGYFPRWISVVNRHHAPQTALILGAVVGFGPAVLLHVFGEQGDVGKVLLNMAVFGAVVSYALVMVSYILLRVRRPDLPRPYRSPLGIPGAAIGAGLAILALIACFLDADVRMGVIGTAIFLVLGFVYYLAYSRHRLVAQAPEEEVALVAKAHRELAHDA